MSKELQELTESIEAVIVTAKLMGYQTVTIKQGSWRISKRNNHYLKFYILSRETLVVTSSETNDRYISIGKSHEEKLDHLQKLMEEL